MKKQNKDYVNHKMKPYHRIFRRPCKRCGQMFLPKGKMCKICDNCNLNKISWKQRELKSLEKLENNYPLMIYKKSLRDQGISPRCQLCLSAIGQKELGFFVCDKCIKLLKKRFKEKTKDKKEVKIE